MQPISPITSSQNPRVKLARALADKKGRREHGLFLVEGTKLLREAVTWGHHPTMTFATADWWAEHAGDPAFVALPGERFEVTDHVLAAIATTQTPDPVVSLLPLLDAEPLSLPPEALVVIAHRLQDPGNLGTIVRAADAAGADAVLVTDQTVDPYSPKVVRATMGSLFHLPVVRQPLEAWVKANPEIPVFAMTLSGAQSLYGHDFRHGAAFLIGNEGQGLTEADTALATQLIKIPIPGNAESLNAAMAATICLYEAVRQRLAP